jgi:hypothetical protein
MKLTRIGVDVAKQSSRFTVLIGMRRLYGVAACSESGG